MTTQCVVRTRARPSRSETLGVPFIKISLCFARTTDGRPYRFGGGFDVVIVGTGVLDGPRIKRNVTKSLPLRGNLVASDC